MVFGYREHPIRHCVESCQQRTIARQQSSLPIARHCHRSLQHTPSLAVVGSFGLLLPRFVSPLHHSTNPEYLNGNGGVEKERQRLPEKLHYSSSSTTTASLLDQATDGVFVCRLAAFCALGLCQLPLPLYLFIGTIQSFESNGHCRRRR